MNLVVMVITACLANGQCRDFRMPLDADISLRQCEMRGQISLAQWAGEHPAFTIHKYRCVDPQHEKVGT